MMQSFAKEQTKHRRESAYDESERSLYRPFNGTTAQLHNRFLFSFTKSDSTRNNGRMDLSFTKCNFPEDYLPYAGGGKTKRLDTCDLTNYRSSGYDNLAFGSNEEFTVGPSHKLSHSQPYGLQDATKHSHLSSATPYTPSFTTSYNSLERGRRGQFTASSQMSAYHDPYQRSTAGALTLPLPMPSSSSTTSSSCLTTHHLHPSTQTGRGRKLAKSCGCCVLVLFATLILVSLSLVVGFSLYLAIVTNFLSKTPLVYSISGNFKVVSGDNFNMRLLNQTSEDYIRKSTRYESIMQHILEKSLIADSILQSEVYSFRKGSLIVFFRMYAAKSKLDGLLDLQSKAIINLNTIESVYIEDSVILNRLRDIVRSAFRASKPYLNQVHGDIAIDIDSVKIGHLDQMTEHYFRLEKQNDKESASSANIGFNVNSHKWASFITNTETSVNQDDSNFRVHSSPAASGNRTTQRLPPVSSATTIEKPITKLPATQSTVASKRPTEAPIRKQENTITVTLPNAIDLDDNENDHASSNQSENRKLVKEDIEEAGNKDSNEPATQNIILQPQKSNANNTEPLQAKGEKQLQVTSLENSNENKVILSGQSNGTNLLTASSQEQVVKPKQLATTSTVFTDKTSQPEKPSQANEPIIEKETNNFTKSDLSNKNKTKHEENEFSELLTDLKNKAELLSPKENLVKVEGRENTDVDDAVSETSTIGTVASAESGVEATTTMTNGNAWNSPQETSTQPSEMKTSTQISSANWTGSSLGSFSSHTLSVDGFAIVIAENEDDAMSNSSVQLESNLPSDVKINDNNTNNVTPAANRVLVASENSFDLYSLHGTVATLPDENKPVKNSNGTESSNEFMDGTHDEFLLYSSQVDGANTFGKRISKKLNNQSFKLNSIGEHDPLSKPEKAKEYNKLSNMSIEHFNDVNGPNLKEELTTVTTVAPTTSTTTMTLCEADEFQCTISGECIMMEEKCDGKLVHCRDGTDESDCRCADYLRKDPASTHKICDGILDCEDRSDEHDDFCSECQKGMFLCRGHQSQCIEMSKVCNGEIDCVHGDDEHGCIALVDPTDLTSNKIGEHFDSRGILFIRHHGKWGPLCFDNYDVQINEVFSKTSALQVDDMGQAVCKANYFTQLDSINLISLSARHNLSYYSISANISNDLRPTLSLWSSLFEQSKCAQRKVAKIECSNFECGIRPVSSKLRRRIIGGQSSSFGSWPWQVALYREGDFQCGAVIIDEQWLLTAAHCFHSSPKAFWTARAGVLRRGSLLRSYHEEIRRIERIILHPHYVDKGFLNDIALLKLDRPLRFSKYIRTICLPGSEEDNVNNFQNQLCTTIGWGKLYEHGRIFPDTLQEVKLPIISSEECRKRTLFLPLYKITENMFCAGYERGGRDACLGDSGDPLMCQKANGKWLLLGITSNGDGCGRANRPGVYTKVSNYLGWIRDTTATYWPPADSPKCKGHRCLLGKCLNSTQICDKVLDCPEDASDELSCYN